MLSIRTSVVALAAPVATTFSPLAAGHPGESHEHQVTEAVARNLFLRDQSHLRKRCASQFSARGLESRASERRKALVDKLRAERGIHKDSMFRVL